MTVSKGPSSRAQRNRSLRKRAGAASIGVLLSAFAIVAVSTQQAATQVSAGPATPAVVAAVAPDSGFSQPSTAVAADSADQPTVAAPEQPAASVAAAPVHAQTRQS